MPSMSKSRRRRQLRRQTPDRAATVDIVSQLECAIRRPHATLIGAVVGGLVPWFARTLAHDQLPAAWSAGSRALAAIMIAVVLGCAVFSAITVYKFGRATFGCAKKALGFVAAIEGVMLVSTGITSSVALAVLVLINALANGSVIALAREATCKQREPDARRAATRARTRAERILAVAPTAAVTPPARRPARQPAAQKLQWLPRMVDTSIDASVIDAEIVSEERFLS
jgi:hypothetical protein